MPITEILAVLSTTLSSAKIHKLSEIAFNILTLSQPVTLRAMSRISTLSLRTIERFYALKNIDWLLIRVLLFHRFFLTLKQNTFL
jgi:hypothetical protein